MASANVPEVILDINDPQFLITERFHGKPAILSTQVAERFFEKARPSPTRYSNIAFGFAEIF